MEGLGRERTIGGDGRKRKGDMKEGEGREGEGRDRGKNMVSAYCVQQKPVLDRIRTSID